MRETTGRQDAISDADFAADLHKVLRGNATADYVDAARFFSNTYPARGLRNLLHNVLSRLGAAVLLTDPARGG